MRPSLACLSSQLARARLTRLTLFTRSPCGLCDTAKHTMTLLREKQEKQKTQAAAATAAAAATTPTATTATTATAIEPFTYAEINITDPGQQHWRDCYEFDVPVLHVDGLETDKQKPKQKKLFHRWSEEDVLQAMRDVKN